MKTTGIFDNGFWNYTIGVYDFYWNVPKLYASGEIVRDKRYTAAEALASQNAQAVTV